MPPSTSPVVVHATAFSVLFLAGILVAVGFDLGRAVRRAFAPGPVAAHALDAVLVIGALPLVGLGLLLADWGQVRLYAVFGVVSGAVAYHLLASPLLLRAEVAVLRRCARLYTALMEGVRRSWRWARGAIHRGGAPLALHARLLRRWMRAVVRRWVRGKPPAGPAGS